MKNLYESIGQKKYVLSCLPLRVSRPAERTGQDDRAFGSVLIYGQYTRLCHSFRRNNIEGI